MIGDWRDPPTSPTNFINGACMFLWDPKKWDDWWYHIGGVPEEKVKVIAKIPQDGDGETVTVSGIVERAELKGQVLVSYPDPDSHAFCCVLRLEEEVPPTNIRRIVPTGPATIFELFILFTISLNILTFILGTLPEFNHGAWDATFDVIEDVSVAIFTIEYIARLHACVEIRDKDTGDLKYTGRLPRLAYAFTDFYALLDLAAILPFYIDLALVSVDLIPTTFLRAFRLLRLLKMDREADMLSKFDDVVEKIQPALVATGYVGAVIWILFATMMYYFERNNPEVGGRFDSIPGSMYFTMQMLMGEFVINNEFTIPGKVVATCIAIVGTMFFSIPVGLFGGAFLSLASGEDDEDEDGDEEEEVDEKTQEEKEEKMSKMNTDRAWTRVANAGNIYLMCRAGTCYFLSSYGPWGKGLEYGVFLLIFLSILNTVLESVPEIAENKGFSLFALSMEWIALIFFTVEYFGRLWCVIDSFDERLGKQEYAGAVKGRVAWALSFFGIVDFLSFFPFFVLLGVMGTIEASTWNLIYIFRLIRILKMERYLPAFTLFDNVFSQSRTLLFGLGYTVLVLWLIFSCLMYMAEVNHKPVAPDDDIVDHPYSNMLDSMWYTLLNITGEFPLGDYSVPGKVIGFFMVIFAIELYGAASGVFAEGFQAAVQSKGVQKDVW